jgi:carboxypeptidase C (cathepsin A)
MRFITAVLVVGMFSQISCADALKPAPPLPTRAAADSFSGDLLRDQAIETASETDHSTIVQGKRISYKAIAGTLTLRDGDGKPTASMFYVAYLVKPGSEARPITFLYNGGPGSSSVWIHMASFGPRRVAIDKPDVATANPPYHLIDNDASLLPASDLVFLDAVNTGYSRPLGDAKPDAFMSADTDIDSFARAIERFLDIQGRWNSPKYLFGESYGTTRSAGLVNRLQKDGAQFNGVIMLGSVLDFPRIANSDDRLLISDLPTYALTAVYHHKVPVPPDQNKFIEEVIDWSEGPYARGLAKGYQLSADERTSLAQTMARYTGLSEKFIVESNLRVLPNRFRAQLLRDRSLVIGELDTRFSGPELASFHDEPSYDPSGNGVFRTILAGFHDYLARDLEFHTSLPYRFYDPETARNFNFNRRATHTIGIYGDDLSQAMTDNPRLRVLSLNGLYDLSTAFYGAMYDYAHLNIAPQIQRNVRRKLYGAGHMAYVDDRARRDIAADVSSFYEGADVTQDNDRIEPTGGGNSQ